LRSVRALWDATYVDESWIDEPVMLLPRMRDWIARNYPGTKLAITEYNWGGLESMNGALAQAEILGIFGRDGVDLAALWAPPGIDDPGTFAFRMYRDYDGHGSGFGDESVAVANSHPHLVGAFAATDERAVTLMLVNKAPAAVAVVARLEGHTGASHASVWRYGAADLSVIVREPDIAVAASEALVGLPAESITLLEFDRLGNPTPTDEPQPTVSPTAAHPSPEPSAAPILLPRLETCLLSC
jgi:hypothetical protein